MLDTAKRGLADLKGDDPGKHLVGLNNVAAFGRAVTIVLQNLRPVVDGFDAWYDPKQDIMRASPVCRHFNRIRNEILKEGRTSTSVSTHAFSRPGTAEDLLAAAGPAPPGATSMVLGDRYGGNGWRVTLPDGSTATYYVSLPDDLAKTDLLFSREVREPAIREQPVAAIAEEYVEHLEGLVLDAERSFGNEQ
jgi:hypothetical protein